MFKSFSLVYFSVYLVNHTKRVYKTGLTEIVDNYTSGKCDKKA